MIGSETFRCACCGAESEQGVVNSTNQFGSPDLDLRPPEMMRSTMPYWVQECPGCGYCAPNLSEGGAEEVRAFVLGQEYQADRARHGDLASDLARKFLLASSIRQHAGDPLAAAESALRAAWACDDAPGPAAEQAARAARGLSADLFAEALGRGQVPEEARGAIEAVLVDVLRRCGRFEEAEEIARVAPARPYDENVQAVFRHQLGLIARRDADRHTVQEVEGLR